MTRGHVVVAVNVLHARLAEPWTLNALADEVHLSRSHLVRAFDATVGTSPMAYLRWMRVERMALLLASTDLSIAEAALSVGWKNQVSRQSVFPRFLRRLAYRVPPPARHAAAYGLTA